ncbi:MAG: phosphate/phosphite/phosphonate ABC transporter substrate-binding protein [Pseudobdellovibrionaceae bacterium]
MKLLKFGLIFLAGLSCSCTINHEKGSAKNPITVSLIPAKDTRSLLVSAEEFSRWMEKETGWSFEVTVPHAYIAVVEALGSNRADIAFLNTTAYIMAHQKYQAEAQFISLGKDGSTTYRGQFISRKDSPVKKLADIDGKKMAYVDPTSASGYLLPAYQLKQLGISPKEKVFAGKHDSVVIMVYQKQVDVGATYHAPEENGVLQDARRLVKTQFPDVFDKIQILDFTIPFPNDAIVFRKGLDPVMKEKLAAAMLKWTKTPEGIVTLKPLNNSTGIQPVKDSDYDEARKLLEVMKSQLN